MGFEDEFEAGDNGFFSVASHQMAIMLDFAKRKTLEAISADKNRTQNFTNQINEAFEITPQQIKKWESFKTNLLNGIDYYKSVFENSSYFQGNNERLRKEILKMEYQLTSLEFNTIPV